MPRIVNYSLWLPGLVCIFLLTGLWACQTGKSAGRSDTKSAWSEPLPSETEEQVMPDIDPCDKIDRTVLLGDEAKLAEITKKLVDPQTYEDGLQYATEIIMDPAQYCLYLVSPNMDNIDSGKTLAHLVVEKYDTVADMAMADRKIYTLRQSDNAGIYAGYSVAHTAVKNHENAALFALTQPAIYRLAQRVDMGENGFTVAHVAVKYHEQAALYAIERPELFRIEQPYLKPNVYAGISVAHICVEYHEQAALYALKKQDIYMIAQPSAALDFAGWSVAHAAVKHHASAADMALKNPKIAKMRSANGTTVGEIAELTLQAP